MGRPKKEQEPKQVEEVVYEGEGDLEPAPRPKKKLSNIEKAKLVNNLAEGATDSELLHRLSNLQSGDVLLKLFTDAVDKAIGDLMGGGEVEAVPQETVNTVNLMREIMARAAGVNDFLKALSNNRLLATLGVMNNSLGGAPVEMPQNAQYQPVESVQQASSQPRKQQRAIPQEAAAPVAGMD